RNSGDYATDGTPPAVVGGLTAVRDGDRVVVRWTAPGDDGKCGTASTYRVLPEGGPAASTVPKPAAAGAAQSLTVDDADGKLSAVTVQAVDDAGNAGIPCRVSIDGGAVRCGMTASVLALARELPSTGGGAPVGELALALAAALGLGGLRVARRVSR